MAPRVAVHNVKKDKLAALALAITTAEGPAELALFPKALINGLELKQGVTAGARCTHTPSGMPKIWIQDGANELLLVVLAESVLHVSEGCWGQRVLSEQGEVGSSARNGVRMSCEVRGS